MRERLIEILQNHDYYAHCERCTRYIKACESCRDERLANHLIENGVVLPVRCKDCTECENHEICPEGATMKERLIELINQFDELDFCIPPHWWTEHFADYLLANGVIVPPVKVGDAVYEVDSVRVYESRVKRVIYETTTVAFDETAIGGSIFLSREDAERALAERSKS